jgi:hypothetical protein
MHPNGPDKRSVAARLSCGICVAAAILGVWTTVGVTPDLALAAQDPTSKSNSDGQALLDLITRYRFSERYTTSGETTSDGTIGQYRAAIKETIKETVGQSGNSAAVKQQERAESPTELFQDSQIIYVDRPAEVSSLGQVKSLVRRYEKAAISANTGPSLSGSHPIEGLTIWYKSQVEDVPQILSMTEGRMLRESEYWFAAKQLVIPSLTNILPPTPLRIGETWQLPKMAIRTMVGGDRILQGGLIGKLVEVRNDAKGFGSLAVLDISGRIEIQNGRVRMRTAVRAQIQFTFFPSRPGESTVGLSRDRATVDARGAIARLSMAQSGTGAFLAEGKPRTVKRELILERQFGNTGLLVDVPREPPKPTPENSWLTYVDPQNRFHFRHPQDLYQPRELGDPADSGPDKLVFAHWRLVGGRDLVVMQVRTDAPQKPEEVKEKMLGEYRGKGLEVLEGSAGWLPEVDWPSMKAYRFEAALPTGARGPEGSQRVHLDGYVVNLGDRASVVVGAMSSQDTPIQFRKDVEAMLRTFRLGLPETQ